MKKAVFVLSAIFLALSGNIGLKQVESQQHTIIVDSNNLRFNPESITINEGDSVNFLWSGELLPHNSVEENGIFDSGDAERDVNYTYTFDFDQAGTYDFFCEPHQSVGMKGVITVLDVEQIIEDSNQSIVSLNVMEYEDDRGGIEIVASFDLGFGLLLLNYFRTTKSHVYVL